MARENTTILYGWVSRPPERVIVDEEEGVKECRFRVLVMRRTFMNDEMLLRGKEREDEIPVVTRSDYVADTAMEELTVKDNAEPGAPEYRGCFILLKGTVCTRFETIYPVCPECGRVCPHDKTVTYIDPIGIIRCNFDKTATYAEAVNVLRSHIEVSSKSILYGSVCREPEYYAEGNTELRFPLRSVRKRHIFEDPIDKKCDYPWIRSFGEHNEGFSQNIAKGSGIYIDGAVQSRDYEGQMIECECGAVFPISGRASEVVPYAVKYQNRCGQDEEDDEDLARMRPNENTVFLYAWIESVPEFSTNSDTAGINVCTARKQYETDDPMYRGKACYDHFFVTTENRNIIKYITEHLMAEQPKDAEGYNGYMVLIKGTLYMRRRKRRVICEKCGKETVHTWGSAFIDPIGIWAEGGPFEMKDAMFHLHRAIEMSNIVFCHGTLTDDPFLEGEKIPECNFPIETTRNRRIWDEENVKPDIPTVVVAGKKALECTDALHAGSVIFINGALRNKTYHDMPCLCESCGHLLGASEKTTEIIPYQVEYHTDCIIPESVAAEEDIGEDDE